MHKCSIKSNPSCVHCGFTEDNIHLFTKFTRISKIWKHCQPLLTKLLWKAHNTIQQLLTLSIKKQKQIYCKINTNNNTSSSTEIWQSRNNNKYDKISLPQYAIINKINTQLQTTTYKCTTKSTNLMIQSINLTIYFV